MNGPPEINRLPLGLLGFLGIKNGGRYPTALAPGLTPTWDQGRMYLEPAARYVAGSGTINANGFVGSIAPQPGEIWVVHDCSLVVAAGAGESWSGALCRGTVNGGSTINLTLDRAAAASSTVSLPLVYQPIWLVPGDIIGAITYAVAGPVDFYLSMRYTVLTI